MSALLTYFDDHTFLALLALCFMFSLSYSCLFTVRRILRFVTIWFRGWPPQHVDADGDWEPDEEKEDV